MDIYLSVHIPKTAGTLFGRALQELHSDLLFFNYGLETPATRIYEHGQLIQPPAGQLHRDYFRERALQDRPGMAIMHGHFWVSTYLDLLPRAKPVVWLREPAQRLRSHYEFWTSKPPQGTNPKYELFRQEQFDFTAFATHPEFTNRLHKFTTGVALEDYAFVGILERFEDSLATVASILPSLSIPNYGKKVNHNPNRNADAYEIEAEILDQIRLSNQLDYELYHQAEKILDHRCEHAPATHPLE